MTKFLYTLVFTLCVLCMNAQTLWTGAISNDWNDAANWTAGIPTSGQTATLPVMEEGNSPIYDGSPVIDFTIQNAGTLTFNTVVFNNGTIINFGGGIIINNNYFINAGSMVFDNDGIFNNEGVFDNFGTYEHAASAELNNLGTFNSLGDFNSNGPISNEGSFTVSGKFITTQKLENAGTLNVTGFVDFPFGSELINTTAGRIEIGANAKMQINSPLTNSGLVVNNGSFAVQSASVVENTGTIRNNASLELSGKIMNQRRLVNADGMMIKSGGQLENKDLVNNQGEITMEICAMLIQDSDRNIEGSIQTDGLTYEINGSANETNLEFGETFNDLSLTPSPQPACKSDNFFYLDESGIIEFTAADIDRGRSYGSCGAQLVEITVNPTSFTAADAGVRIVELTVTDNFGRTATCEDFVTIIPYAEPITATNSNAIDSDCSEDITASTLPGANFAEVNFPAPVATSSCSGMPVTSVDCSSTPNDINGLVFMGEYNGSKYYCSNSNSLTWHEARDLAVNLGGHLATVNDAEENEFIRNNILADFAWIGYTDEAVEGSFKWVSGTSNYENWKSGEPNNTDATGSFTRILKSSGQWTDRDVHFQAEAVIEVPCSVVMENSCEFAPEVDGMMYLGTFENSHYYKKPEGDLRYAAAKAFVESRGGNLPVINSEAENSFLRNAAGSGRYWLAFTDENQEGSFEWTTGAPVSYTNWNQNEPNNYGTGEDYTMVRGNGTWNDTRATSLAWAIMEIPCQANTGSTVCSLDNFGTEGTAERIVWIKEDGESATYFETVGENTFQEFSDGTALLTGRVQEQGNSNRRYSFSVKLENKRTHAEWTGLGRLVKEENTPYGDPTTWSFYELVEGESTFTGEGNFAGQTLNLTHMPADYSYGFQVGFGANVKDSSFGISGWWSFSGSRSGRGDFNADLNNCTILPGGDGEVTVTQIQGIQSGDNFPVGTTQIAYRITDDCGNEEICLFDVVVEATPSELTLTNCPGDIVVDAPICEEGTIVSWELPAATTTCYIDDIIVNRVDENPSSGEFFPIGTTTISYIVADSCGNAEVCVFNVIVNEVEGELTVDCIDDFTVTAARNETAAIANFAAPTGTTTGTGVTVRQLDGPASGASLEIGTYPVIFLISDDCNNTELCIFNITIEPTVIDDDNDGVPVEEDCDDNDASIPTTAGTTCDDNNDDTIEDVIQADGCTCAGIINPCILDQLVTVSSEDLLCENTGAITFTFADEADRTQIAFSLDGGATWKPNILDNLGAVTYADLSAGTYELAVRWGNGECPTELGSATIAGNGASPVVTTEVANPNCGDAAGSVTFSFENFPGRSHIEFSLDGGATWEVNVADRDGSVTYAGLPAGAYDLAVRWGNDDCPTDLDPVTLSYANIGQACNDGDACTTGDVYDADCNCVGVIADADNDGVCDSEDCDDTDPSIPATPGTDCDDGDASTENDVIAADGCSCGGNVIVDVDGDGVRAEEDCDDNDPSIPTAPGTACDDGDVNTENDVIAADGCSCGGNEIVDADGDGIRAEEDCDDNDPSIPTAPGTVCNDNNSLTENDIIGADGCSCAGTLIPTCTVAGGQIAFLDGSTEQTICADDEIANPLAVNVFGPIGTNQQWVITDDQLNILGLPTAPPFDLEGAGAGTCLIWSLSYEDGLEGVAVGANAGDLDGCFELSNSISVIRLTGADCPNFIVDADGDGIAADEDCDDNDPSIPTTPGTACDDANPATENDVILSDGCGCSGTPIIVIVDNDNDGVPADEDCDDNDPSVPATPGSTCDDANADTENDIVTADGCGCEGTPVVVTGPDCGDISITVGDGSFTVAGLDGAPVSSVQCFNAAWQEEYKCFGDCDASITENVAPGSYRIYVKYYTASYQLVCTVEEVIEVTAGQPVDNDNDGVPAGEDCDDNDPSVPTTPGTACDDANADTENDVILANGCDCAGTNVNGPTDNDNDGVPADEDCDDNDPSVPATPGTACDDGNVDTENDVVTADGCGCEGTPIVVTGPDCGDISITVGDGSFTVSGLDGAPVSSVQCFNSQWQEEYKCFGDCDASITENVAPGSYRIYVKYYTASYQLICTVEEVIEVGEGEPVDNDGDGVIASEDCDDNDPSVPTTPGTACDDGNADTENDVILANGCDCAGTNVNGPTDNDGDGVPAGEDCDDNDPSVPATPGSTCDDGNADTENDVVTADGCGCEGTPVIVSGPDCGDISITVGDGSFTVAGLDGAPVSSVQCFNSQWQEEYKCFGDCDASITETVAPGSYRIYVKYYTASYQLICTVEEVIEVTGGQPIVDNDNDGVPADEDCDDNNSAIPAAPGTACDDNNPNTVDDVILADGCDCAGTVITTNVCVKYQVTDAKPECGPFPDESGVFFRRDCGESFEVWKAGDDLILEERGDGTAVLRGSVYNGATIGVVNIEYWDYNSTGDNWADACYNDLITEEYFYNHFAGTITIDGFSYTIVEKPTGKDIVFGLGANNESNGSFGFGGWLDGTWGTCVESFGTLTPLLPGATCNDNDPDTVDDVILADGCSCAGVEVSAEVCTTRTASNVEKCTNGLSYGGWLKLSGEGNHYDISNSELVEYTDGTAWYTATWTNKGDASIVFDLEINIAGKTTIVPADSPKEHLCSEVDTDAFYYYSDFEGVLIGRESVEGAEIAISTFGAALQIGVGANATGSDVDALGMSAWFSGELVQQPANGNALVLNPGADGHLGDINVELTGSTNDCDNVVSQAIAPNASFLHLNGNKIGSSVGLDWTTNNDYRTTLNIVERSENGTDWMAIEETASLTQSTSATFYQTKDEQPAFGVNHYRVKQLMNDGTFLYSNVVEIRFDVDPAKVVVYPNPTVEEVNISLVEYAGRQGNLKIANALGQKMYEVSFDEIPTAPVHVELDNTYQAGTYTIMISIEGRKPVAKMFIVSKL